MPFCCSAFDDFKRDFMHLNEGQKLSVGFSRIDTVTPLRQEYSAKLSLDSTRHSKTRSILL